MLVRETGFFLISSQEGAFSILSAHRDGADLFTTDDRLKILSFTGSPEMGWDLKVRNGKKKAVLDWAATPQ